MNDQLVLYYYEGDVKNFPGIEVTIKSLRDVYTGSIVVLCNNVSTNLLEFLKSYNVEIINCNLFNVKYKTSPFNNKIIYTYLFLKSKKEKFNFTNILFCDIGDMYFQINPFKLLNNKIYVSLETDQIKHCPVNREWLKICYGEDITKTIERNIVINSGFILGSYTQLLNLFHNMTKDMSQIFSKINYPITDQAILNKLVYYDKLECHLGKQTVINISQYKGPLKFGKNIVHQYKVNKELTQAIYQHYGIQ
jgi:hypothetical protein